MACSTENEIHNNNGQNHSGKQGTKNNDTRNSVWESRTPTRLRNTYRASCLEATSLQSLLTRFAAKPPRRVGDCVERDDGRGEPRALDYVASNFKESDKAIESTPVERLEKGRETRKNCPDEARRLCAVFSFPSFCLAVSFLSLLVFFSFFFYV